jgi:hypothetical protein
MSRRYPEVIVLLVAASIAGAIVWSKRSGPAPVAASPTHTGPFAESAWPSGSHTTFHVGWKTNARASLEGARESGLETSFDLEGELRIDSYGAREEGIALGLRWTRIDRATAEALAKPIAPAGALEAQLRDAETVVVIEPKGRVRELGFSDATTPLARLIQRAIVLDLTAEIAAGSGFLDVVDTALGRARIEKRVAVGAENGASMTSRAGYDELDAFPFGLQGATMELDARGEVHRDPSGSIDRVTSNESLSTEASGGMVSAYRSSTSLSANLVSRTQGEALAVPAYTPSTVRTSLDAGYDRNASLERRSLGVTPATLHADVRSASLMPRAGTTQWIWRDAAYLELHPEQAEPLLTSATKELDLARVAAAFDIIVIAGTPQGQAALVRALEGPAAEREDAYIVLVQRLSFVTRPTKELVAFVVRERARWAGTDRGRAALYALGALAHNLAADDAMTADTIVRGIAADLVAAKTNEERVVLLAALGNAGRPGTADGIIAHARSTDVQVRREVANALRKIEVPAVVDALLELIVDPAPEVASVAIDSLFRKQLDDDDWGLLLRQVAGGHIPADAHAGLVSALARRHGDGTKPNEVLMAMAASPHVAQDVKQRIETVLRE